MILFSRSEMQVGRVYEFADPHHLNWCGFRVKRVAPNGRGSNIIAANKPKAGFGWWCNGVGQYAEFSDGRYWKPVSGSGFAEWVRTKGK